MLKDTRLFHVSDVHFGVHDEQAHRWFAEAVARERPDAVICSGDITQRARKSQFAAAAEWFGRMGVPVLLEPGNHDMPYYNLIERFTDPFRRYDNLAAALGVLPSMPGLAIIPFRTTVPAQWRFPWSDGVISPRALGQTVANLEALKDEMRLKIVVCHHPLVGRDLSDARNKTRGGLRAFRALAKAGADLVLSGHIHDAFDITHSVEGRNLRMIGAGTLSTRLRNSSPSFNVLAISGDGQVQVEHRELMRAE